MTSTDNQSDVGGLVQRVEVLLSSLTAVVSARVILDQAKGAHVHIIATAELPVSEVTRAVMSALTWGLGFEVPSDHITVVQSRLSREQLRALLLSETADPSDTSGLTEEPPATPAVTGGPPAEGPPPTSPVPDTGLLEFSLGGTQGDTTSESELDLRRLELEDLQVLKNSEGRLGISVRLAYQDRSIGALREAAGTEEDLLEVPASTALGVIQEFLRVGREDAPSVLLRFLAARRLRHPQHDTVVVLVEAIVRGRRIPMTGAASANDGVERASILATLQATNAFVSGTMNASASDGTQ